jgi:hypothetical protein
MEGLYEEMHNFVDFKKEENEEEIDLCEKDRIN